MNTTKTRIPGLILALTIGTSGISFAQNLQKFSTTQKLNPMLKDLVGITSIFNIEWDKDIKLPAHPDSALETKFLLQQQKKLTPAKLVTIKAENNPDLIMALYLEPKLKAKKDVKENPMKETQMLCDMLQNELVTAVLGQKLKFDRVRPSFVNPDLKLPIPNPKHPAYPSGHSTQSYLFAYVLGSLNPAKANDYVAKATDIAINREIAGVHYRSDSFAGQVLAKYMARRLATNKKFQVAYLKAAVEWGTADEGVAKLKKLLQYSLTKPSMKTK